jgi:O-antigen/teichoic acid export membrane protein
MERQFSFNIILLILVNLLIKPFYIFGIEIPVQNIVGNESYGLYFTFLNLTYLFQIINDPGIQNYNSKEIAASPTLLRRFFPQILLLKLILALFFVAAVATASAILGYWQFDPLLLAMVMAGQVLVSVVQYTRTNVAAVGMFAADSLLSVLDKFLMIIGIGLLLWVLSPSEFNMRTFVLIQLISLIITWLGAIFLLRSKLEKLVWKWNRAVNRIIIKNSLPQALVIFLMFLYSRTDAVMIKSLLEDGSYQAGIYAAAFRIMDAFTMFTFLFAALLVPMFSKKLKTGKNIVPIYYQSLHWVLAIALTGACSVFAFRNEWMGFLYTDTSDQSGSILGILIWAFAFKSTNFVCGSLIVASGELRKLNILLAVTVLINVAVNAILIPSMGGYGAAIATFGTQVIVAVGMYLLSLPFLKEKNHALKLFPVISALFLIAPGYYFIKESGLSFGWHWQFLMLVAYAILAAFVARLLKIRELLYFARGIFERGSANSN